MSGRKLFLGGALGIALTGGGLATLRYVLGSDGADSSQTGLDPRAPRAPGPGAARPRLRPPGCSALPAGRDRPPGQRQLLRARAASSWWSNTCCENRQAPS
ncbi:MAG: hypothetical protein EXR72_26695 [Myxococcales bacterium]|nr:hypothetical protein [Myxococcales bacterium]